MDASKNSHFRGGHWQNRTCTDAPGHKDNIAMQLSLNPDTNPVWKPPSIDPRHAHRPITIDGDRGTTTMIKEKILSHDSQSKPSWVQPLHPAKCRTYRLHSHPRPRPFPGLWWRMARPSCEYRIDARCHFSSHTWVVRLVTNPASIVEIIPNDPTSFFPTVVIKNVRCQYVYVCGWRPKPGPDRKGEGEQQNGEKIAMEYI